MGRRRRCGWDAGPTLQTAAFCPPSRPIPGCPRPRAARLLRPSGLPLRRIKRSWPAGPSRRQRAGCCCSMCVSTVAPNPRSSPMLRPENFFFFQSIWESHVSLFNPQECLYYSWDEESQRILIFTSRITQQSQKNPWKLRKSLKIPLKIAENPQKNP